MKQKIWLSSPHMGGKEQKYIQEAFDNNWIAPLGPNVVGLEGDICKYAGCKSASCLSSGTAALHLALVILGVDRGDEVICSSFTFSASCNPIIYQGAIPIFIDSERDTWNMDPELLEIAIKERLAKGKKPKVVIVVHLYGMPANMKRIEAICNEFQIPIIEDAAEALGSTYEGKQVGTFGEIGIFSFNGNKIITTSGGGALISNNQKHCEKATFLATQARDNAPHYQHTQIGYNYRMSNVVAGIGRGQMEVIDLRVKQRRDNFFIYRKELSAVNGISFLEEPSSVYFSNYWLTTVLIEPSKARFTRDDLRLALEKENIESRPLWKPMHLQPVFDKYPKYLNGTSDELFEKGLCLPSGSNLNTTDVLRVVEVIKSFL